MIIAQISDLHVAVPGSNADAAQNGAAGLANAVAHLNALHPRPAVVVASGDLVSDGQAAQYDRLAELLAPLEIPIYLLPGNHDDRELLRQKFAAHSYLPAQGFLQYVVECDPLRLIVLDTNVPGEAHGELCADRLDWLDRQLAEAAGRPTLVFQHHPPFATGMAKMDAAAFVGAEPLGRVLARHDHVEHLLCGHLHRSISRRFHGTIATTCPSTAFQLTLDLGPEKRLSLAQEPAACLLHYWGGDGGLVTHTSMIGSANGRLLFDGERWRIGE